MRLENVQKKTSALKLKEKGNIFEDIGVDNKLCDGNDKMLRAMSHS